MSRSKSRRSSQAMILAEAGVAAALAWILSRLRIFRMPQGGSVSLELVPILYLAFYRGTYPGVLAGLAAGLMFLAGWLAGGGLGSGRMSDLGPNALYTAAATFALTFVGGVICDQLRRLRNWRADRRIARFVDVREESNDILDVGRHIG